MNFGDIVFSHDTHKEYLLAEELNVRVVACCDVNEVRLYRIEWGLSNNIAAYSLPEAIQIYQEKLSEKKQIMAGLTAS